MLKIFRVLVLGMVFSSIALADDYVDQATFLTDLMAISGGMTPLRERTNYLHQGQTITWESYMAEGHTYAFKAVCDEDCGDVDLFLRDSNGNIVDKDDKTDDEPVVSVTPRWSDNFTLIIRMISCSNGPCKVVTSSYRVR